MKMKHIDVSTFNETEIEIEDFLYELTDEIRKSLHMKYYPTVGDVSIILTTDEGVDNKLIVGFFKNRKLGELSHRYKITIEKLPE